MLAYKLAERLFQGKDRYFLSEIMWLVLYRIQKLWHGKSLVHHRRRALKATEKWCHHPACEIGLCSGNVRVLISDDYSRRFSVFGNGGRKVTEMCCMPILGLNEGLAHIDPSHLEKQASVVAEVTSQDQHELDNPLLVVNENDMPCPCMSTAWLWAVSSVVCASRATSEHRGRSYRTSHEWHRAVVLTWARSYDANEGDRLSRTVASMRTL